jgi:hypothetical protein
MAMLVIYPLMPPPCQGALQHRLQDQQNQGLNSILDATIDLLLKSFRLPSGYVKIAIENGDLTTRKMVIFYG